MFTDVIDTIAIPLLYPAISSHCPDKANTLYHGHLANFAYGEYLIISYLICFIGI